MSRLGGSLGVLRGRGDVTTLVLILGGLGSLRVFGRRRDVAALVVVVVLRLRRGLAILGRRRDVTALVLILRRLGSFRLLRRRRDVATLPVLVVLRLGRKLGVLRGRAITTLVLVVLGRRGLAIFRRRGDIATLVVVRQVAVSGGLGSGRSLLEVGGAFKTVLTDDMTSVDMTVDIRAPGGAADTSPATIKVDRTAETFMLAN